MRKEQTSSHIDNYLLLKDKDYNNAARILMYVNMDIVFDSPIDIENTSIRITYKSKILFPNTINIIIRYFKFWSIKFNYIVNQFIKNRCFHKLVND